MPMSPRTTFHCDGLHALLGKIRQYTYVLCDCLLIKQMALSFSINILTWYIFIARPK